MENNSTSHLTEEWEQEVEYEEVSIEDLDAAVQEFVDSRAEYDEKKKVSNEADAACKFKKRKLIEMLKRSGKKNWEVDGLGKVSKTIKYTVSTPKDLEKKAEMLKYFKEQGADLYLSIVNVNYQTLNSYINQEIENDPSFKMPGVEDPIAQENLMFRRSK